MKFSLFVVYIVRLGLRPWQTRTHCCGHIVADKNVSLFACACNICCGHKFSLRDTKNVSDFVQKHFVSAQNVSQFARARKHHEKQCVHKNESSFARAFRVYDMLTNNLSFLTTTTTTSFSWYMFLRATESSVSQDYC